MTKDYASAIDEALDYLIELVEAGLEFSEAKQRAMAKYDLYSTKQGNELTSAYDRADANRNN